jgi:hypothetical protein
MDDRTFRNFALFSSAIFFLWWVHRRKQQKISQPEETQIIGLDSPDWNTQFYTANPDLFNPADITVNVNGFNPMGFSRIPLFGFVGMAHGDTWQ